MGANLWSLNPKDWTEDDVSSYGSLNPEQLALTKALGPRLQALASGPEYYGGQLTEPISTAETANVERFNALSQSGYDTLSRLGTYDPAAFNNQFREEVASPAYSNFRQFEQPILEEAVPYSGSARAQTVGDAVTQLRNQLLTTQFSAREAQKDRALGATQAMPGYASGTAQVLSIPREIKQAGLDRQYTEYTQANARNREDIQRALNFLGISTVTRTEDALLERLLAALAAGAKTATAAAGA